MRHRSIHKNHNCPFQKTSFAPYRIIPLFLISISNQRQSTPPLSDQPPQDKKCLQYAESSLFTFDHTLWNHISKYSRDRNSSMPRKRALCVEYQAIAYFRVSVVRFGRSGICVCISLYFVVLMVLWLEKEESNPREKEGSRSWNRVGEDSVAMVSSSTRR